MKMARWAVAVLFLATAACSQPSRRIDPDQDDDVGGTGIDSADIRNTADGIARALLSDQRLFEKGKPVVVIESPTTRSANACLLTLA